MNGIHRHKCETCKRDCECPLITHCKQPYEVAECWDCLAFRIQREADIRNALERPDAIMVSRRPKAND